MVGGRRLQMLDGAYKLAMPLVMEQHRFGRSC